MLKNVPPVIRQFITIICCYTITFSYGTLYAWAPANINDLQDENSTLPMGPLSVYETSLVISILNVGAFVGNFGVVPIIFMFGPKRTTHLFSIPLIISSLLVIWAQNVYFLYFSRLLIGFVGGGLPVLIPTIITDICFDNVRGALSSLYDTSLNIGMVVSFFIGSNLKAQNQAKLYLIMPVIFIAVLFLFPESPEFLKKKGRKQLAIKSFTFYKGTIDDKNHEQCSSQENGKISEQIEIENDSKLSLKDFTSLHARKACFIAFVAYIVCFSCGIYVLLNYMTEIFAQTGSVLSPETSSLMAAITTMVGNIVFSVIVEQFSRKSLHIGSCILTAIGYFVFATYCSLWINQAAFEWMPPFCIGFINFISCMGLMPIPFIIAIEIFPRKIRAVGLAISLSIMWTMTFIETAIFPTILRYIGLSNCMIIFGVMCLFNVIFGILFVPETRGKSHEEIMKILSN